MKERRVTRKSMAILLALAMCVLALSALIASGSAGKTAFAENAPPVESGYTVTNVALGKENVSVRDLDWTKTEEPSWDIYRDANGGLTTPAAVTDGKMVQEKGCVRIPHGSMAWVVIDLGEEVTIPRIGLNFFDNHPFDRIVAQSSTDADFTDPITLYNTDSENAVGQGVGKAIAYQNTPTASVKIDVNPVVGRYIRVTNRNKSEWAAAHNIGSGFTEIEVYGVTDGVAPVTADHSFEVQPEGFDLTLSHEDADAAIYYTTDGSYPVVGTAEKYTAPIAIPDNDCTLIRAIAVKSGDGGFTTKPVAFKYAVGENDGIYPPVRRAPWEKIEATDVRVSSYNNDGVAVDVTFNADLCVDGNGLAAPGDNKYRVTGLQNMSAYNELIEINGAPIKDIAFGDNYGVNIRYRASDNKWVLRLVVPRGVFNYSIPENQWGGIPANMLAPYINEVVIKEGFPMWIADGTAEGSGSPSETDKLQKNAYIYQRWNGVDEGGWKAKPVFLLGDRDVFTKDAAEGGIASATWDGNRVIRLVLEDNGGYLFDSEPTFVNHIMRQKAHDIMAMTNSSYTPITAPEKLTLHGNELSVWDYAIASGLRYNIGAKIKINGLTLAEWYNAAVTAAIDAGVDPMLLATSNPDFVGGLGDTHVQKNGKRDMLYIQLPQSGFKNVGGVDVEWTLPDLSKGIEIEILPGFGGANATGKSVKFSQGARAVYTPELGWTYSDQNDADGDFARIQAAAKSQIENYKDINDYRPAEQAEFTVAVEACKTAIDAATDVEEIVAAVNSAKATIDALEVDEELVALNAYKKSVRAALEDSVDLTLYRTAEQTQITEKIDELVAAITAVGDDAATAAVAAEFATWLEGVKTDEELTAEEEGLAALNAYKTAVRTALQSSVTLSDYRRAEQAEINGKIDELVAAITEVGDDDAKAAVVANFTAWLDGVKTDAELTAEEEQNKTPAEKPAKKGCNSSVALATILSAMALAGGAFIKSKSL